ncbi:MAG: hypothetical protein N2253_05300 [Bacteroidia bacterium]|nr:hypothetical protein [Bacteroidia bacterium]
MKYFLLGGVLLAQDTLRFMAYNLLLYGATPGYCNTSCKDQQLRTIVSYVRPHLIGVNEIGPSAALVRRILDSVLNVGTVSYWRSSVYANTTNSNIVNALFYDSRYFEWIGQELVTTQGGLRDIYAYHLYYKELPPITDTLFLVVIVSHLKAGNTPSDEQARAQAALAIKQYIQALPLNRRRFVVEMGDHNLYAASEAAYQTLTQELVDPGPAGGWSGNQAFAFYHTQSTRTSSLPDDGVGGGLNDRFDFIFFSPECTTLTARAQYIPGSFRVVGQDGQRFGRALNSQPLPAGYPASVINALYTMSDHLPVIADFRLPRSAAATLVKGGQEVLPAYIYELRSGTLLLKAYKPCKVDIYDVQGRLWASVSLERGEERSYELLPGLYLLRNEEGYTQRLFISP